MNKNKKKIFVICVLLLCFLGYLYAQQSEATVLIGDKGYRVSIGPGLTLSNNVLSTTSGVQRTYDGVLTQSTASAWSLPAGAQNVEVFRNRVKMIRGTDFIVQNDLVVFDSTITMSSTDLITANFDL